MTSSEKEDNEVIASQNMKLEFIEMERCVMDLTINPH